MPAEPAKKKASVYVDGFSRFLCQPACDGKRQNLTPFLAHRSWRFWHD